MSISREYPGDLSFMSLLHTEKEKVPNVISKPWFLQAILFLPSFSLEQTADPPIYLLLVNFCRIRRYSLFASTTCWYCRKQGKLKFDIRPQKILLFTNKTESASPAPSYPKPMQFAKNWSFFFFLTENILVLFPQKPHANVWQLLSHTSREQSRRLYFFFN